jgi:hypothetical protein
MGTVRVVVDDVDAAVAAYASVGYAVARRWGPPFAILQADGTDLWVSGPQTSAARASAELPAELRPWAAVRVVHETDDLGSSVAGLLAAGWEHAAGPVSGPGGSQQLLRRGTVFVEVFAASP